MLKAVFYAFDRNAGGTLSFEEVTKALGSIGLADMLKKQDKNADQQISLEEYLALFNTEATFVSEEDVVDTRAALLDEYFTQRHSPQALMMLEEVYGKFDQDKDGTLTLKELTAVLQGHELSMTYFKTANVDGDDKVSLREWYAFFDPILDADLEEMRTFLLGSPAAAAAPEPAAAAPADPA